MRLPMSVGSAASTPLWVERPASASACDSAGGDIAQRIDVQADDQHRDDCADARALWIEYYITRPGYSASEDFRRSATCHQPDGQVHRASARASRGKHPLG